MARVQKERWAAESCGGEADGSGGQKHSGGQPGGGRISHNETISSKVQGAECRGQAGLTEWSAGPARAGARSLATAAGMRLAATSPPPCQMFDFHADPGKRRPAVTFATRATAASRAATLLSSSTDRTLQYAGTVISATPIADPLLSSISTKRSKEASRAENR